MKGAGYVERSPHNIREPDRRSRLLKRGWLMEASRERLAELLPVVCVCGVVLGMAEAGEELLCRDCGQWIGPDDETPGWIANG